MDIGALHYLDHEGERIETQTYTDKNIFFADMKERSDYGVPFEVTAHVSIPEEVLECLTAFVRIDYQIAKPADIPTIIRDVCDDICENYCKFSGMDEDELPEQCNGCPLHRLQ